MLVLALLVMGLVNIACFMTGAKVGQTVSKGEDIRLPTINPMEVYREHQDKKEAKAEQNRMDTIMDNINNYDGTSYGQKEVM